MSQKPVTGHRREGRPGHPACDVGAPHAGTDRRAQRHLLPLVRSLSEPVAPEALEDRPSRPDRVWNRIPVGIRAKIIDQARAEQELSPCALAVPSPTATALSYQRLRFIGGRRTS